MLSLKDEKVFQSLKYLFVGGSTALLDLGLCSLLFYVFHWPIPAANVLAVLVATTTNFIMNRSWAFKSSEHAVRSMILYVILFLFNAVVTTTILSIGTTAGLPSAVVKLTTQVLVTIWNFFLYRHVIFK